MQIAILSTDDARSLKLQELVLEALGGQISASSDPKALAQQSREFDLLVLDAPLPVDLITRLAEASIVEARRRVLFSPECNLQLTKIVYRRQFHGWVVERETRDVQLAVFRLVMAGGEYFPWFDKSKLLEPAPIEGLSKRQREVLGHLLKGETNKQIAEALGISIPTVKLHVQHILNEVGAQNRTDAVARFGGIKRSDVPL